jgi:hypothetical protein
MQLVCCLMHSSSQSSMISHVHWVSAIKEFSEFQQSKPASYTSCENKFSDFLSSIIFSNYFQGNIATNYFQGNIATLKGRMLSLPLGITCFIQASSIMCAWNNVYFRCLMIFLLWSCNILMLLYFPELLIYLLYYTYVAILNFSYIYRTTYSVAYCTKLTEILHLWTHVLSSLKLTPASCS